MSFNPPQLYEQVLLYSYEWHSIDEETEKLNNLFEVIYLERGGGFLLFTSAYVQITWLPV